MDKSLLTTNPELDFKDISSEAYRVYYFKDGSSVIVENPLALNISKSGGHRIYDSQGFSHYIQPGWNQIIWKVKEGQLPFTF